MMNQTQTLVNVNGTHRKFWKVTISKRRSHNVVNVHWGRIGTKGGRQTKKFAHHWDAMDFVDAKISQKLRNGYEAIN